MKDIVREEISQRQAVLMLLRRLSWANVGPQKMVLEQSVWSWTTLHMLMHAFTQKTSYFIVPCNLTLAGLRKFQFLSLSACICSFWKTPSNWNGKRNSTEKPMHARTKSQNCQSVHYRMAASTSNMESELLRTANMGKRPGWLEGSCLPKYIYATEIMCRFYRTLVRLQNA